MGACSSQGVLNQCKSRSSVDTRANANEMEQRIQWDLLRTNEAGPCERSGHGVVVHQAKAYLFGGFGGVIQCPTHLSDLFCYDFGKKNTFIIHFPCIQAEIKSPLSRTISTASSKWTCISPSGNIPCPRTAFTMCVTPESLIYVWGGTDHDLLGLMDQQLYEFDIFAKRWSIIRAVNPPSSNLRYFGRSCDYYCNKLLFFGGGVKGGRFTNETTAFDLKKLCWKKIETTGNPPCPRYKHQSCIIGDRLFILGGGCYLPPEEIVDTYVLCLKTWVWSRAQTTGNAPQGRAAHTCEYDHITNAIYMWGGFDHSLTPICDFHKLDLRTYHWSSYTMGKSTPTFLHRSFHASCMFEGGLYSFLGSNGECRFADVMRFQIHRTPPRLTILAAQICNSYRVQIDNRYCSELPEELHKLKPITTCTDSLVSSFGTPFSLLKTFAI